ncbi:MAG: hypothetical protein JW914_05870 [Syntrophaceae bacterium]|nr:hypothetical protein [Syntrophaceae bacterium]
MKSKKKSDFETRLQAIENYISMIKYALIIIGFCLIAFLGWQSYFDIPREINKALKDEAITKMNQQAKKQLDEVKLIVEELEKQKQKADKITMSLDKKSLERIESNVVDLEKKVSGRFLRVYNQCDNEIKLIVKYKMPYGDERTLGWWTLKSKTGNYLSEDDKRILLNSDEIYIYAETTKEPKKYWKGDIAGEFKGTTFAFKKLKAKKNKNDYELFLQCID